MLQDTNSQSLFAVSTLDAPTCPDTSKFDWGSLNESIDGLPLEVYARPLLDEVFQEVEYLLNGGGIDQPDSEIKPAPATADGPLDLALHHLTAVEEVTELSIALPIDPAISGITDVLQPQSASQSKSTRASVDRLLLVIGGLAALTTLGTWFLFYQLTRKAAPAAPTSLPVATAPLLSDAQFADYLVQALKNLDQRNQTTSKTTIASTAATPGLNPVQAPPPPTVLPTVTVPSTVSSGPLATTPATGVSQPQPPLMLPFSPPKLPTSVPSVVPLPKFPFNRAQKLTQPNQTALQPGTAPASPAIRQTLVGVLDLGKNDLSAALVEINGVTQRFRVGESIGKGGWNLVEVSKNQATVRRNGEVRTVFVGQSF
mgnify:CR=1 FL=1